MRIFELLEEPRFHGLYGVSPRLRRFLFLFPLFVLDRFPIVLLLLGVRPPFPLPIVIFIPHEPNLCEGTCSTKPPSLTLEQRKNIIERLLRTLRLVSQHLEQRADVSLALARPGLHIYQAEAGTKGKDRPGWDT